MRVIFLLALFVSVLPVGGEMYIVVTNSSQTWAYALPSTNDVERYELGRDGGWTGIAKHDGDVLLGCCQEAIRKNKPWLKDDWTNLTGSFGFRMITTNHYTNGLFSVGSEGTYLMYAGHSVGRVVAFADSENQIAEPILRQWRQSTAHLTKTTHVKTGWSWKIDCPSIQPQTFPRSYEIRSADDGGSLWGIAKHFYGDGTRWPEIYKANTNVIKNPDRIRNGMVIVIPTLDESK